MVPRQTGFDRADLKEKFKSSHGYELGVPVNWSAYEDIADFFTNRSENRWSKSLRTHGLRSKDPSLGWRLQMPGFLWRVKVQRYSERFTN